MKSYKKFIKGIIYLNILMYFVSLILSRKLPELSFNPLTAFSPESGSLFAMGATGTIAVGQLNRWWTLISAGFLHGGILHIFFNMAALWQIGPFVINVFGPWRMYVIYTLGSVAGFYVSYLAGVKFTIGASASVCSLIGALLYYGKSRGDMLGKELFRQVAGWVAGLFVFGLIVPGINNWAHGGGIAAGAVISFFLGYEKKRKERTAHRLMGAACIGLTGLILVVSIVSGFLNRF
jgi:rhomboid protease GluP